MKISPQAQQAALVVLLDRNQQQAYAGPEAVALFHLSFQLWLLQSLSILVPCALLAF